jgi:hypothetical protein
MSIEEIFSNQKNLIRICKKYLNNVKKDKIDIITSPLCFFTTWADTPGNLKVNDFCGVKNKKKIIFIIKNLLTGCKYFDLKLFHKKNCIKKYDNLIVSYSQKNDFDSDGNFLDRYFNYDDKDINSFWILISLDNYVPSNFKSNISIIAKKKKFSFSFGYLFKELFKIIGRSNFNFKMLAHNCWSEYIFAQKIFSISKHT